jgi:hypothetical protein
MRSQRYHICFRNFRLLNTCGLCKHCTLTAAVVALLLQYVWSINVQYDVERCSRQGSTPASYCGGPGFNRPADRLYWLRFSCFFSFPPHEYWVTTAYFHILCYACSAWGSYLNSNSSKPWMEKYHVLWLNYKAKWRSYVRMCVYVCGRACKCSQPPGSVVVWSPEGKNDICDTI